MAEPRNQKSEGNDPSPPSIVRRDDSGGFLIGFYVAVAVVVLFCALVHISDEVMGEIVLGVWCGGLAFLHRMTTFHSRGNQ